MRTALIDWPYFDNRGTPQSDAVQTTERFTLTEGQGRLNFEMTIVDPATL